MSRRREYKIILCERSVNIPAFQKHVSADAKPSLSTDEAHVPSTSNVLERILC